MSDAKNQIVTAINSYGNLTNVTAKAISAFLLGDVTINAVRSLFLNPVINKAIPTWSSTIHMDIGAALYVLYKHYDQKLIGEEVFGRSDEKRINDIFKDIENDASRSSLWYIVDYIMDGRRSFILKMKSYVIYVTISMDTKDYSCFLSLKFISLNGSKVLNEFNTLFEDVIKKCTEEKPDNRNVTVRSMNKGRLSISRCTVPKTIILDHVEKEINNIIAMVKKSEEISSDFQISKSIGILLYGPAGTGKSTIARYLAMVLKRDLILTTPDSLEMAIEEIKGRSSYRSKKFIMLIEDIDQIFADRRDTKRKGRSEDKESNIKTNLLFQVLDGVLSSENLMVIATTNYVERIDPALIRDGRFDFRVEVNGLDYRSAEKVCERFQINPDAISLSRWKLPISPASLQTFILKYKVSEGLDMESPDVDEFFAERERLKKLQEAEEEKHNKKDTTDDEDPNDEEDDDED